MKAIFRLSCCCLLLGVSSAAFAQMCGGPLVRFGEVRSGLEAGLQAGAVPFTVPDSSGQPTPLAEGFFKGTFVEDQRGFISPESGHGWLCEGDFGLVLSWLGLTNSFRDSWGLSPAEHLELTNGLLQTRIVINGVEYESLETRAKWGTIISGGVAFEAATKTWGVFIEPQQLLPGFHLATLVWFLDWDCLPLPLGGSGQCDGNHETFSGSAEYLFEVITNP